MRTLLAAVLLASLAACSRPLRGPAAPALAPALNAAAVWQQGTASWYGGDFHGRATANGEIYDMRKLTAAHPQLPFHTLVEVENLENGRRVLVRINDRGPFLKGRILDLSLKGAQRLGMVEKGTAEVCLRVLRFGDRHGEGRGASRSGAAAQVPPAPAQREQSEPPPSGHCVQAGAFAARANAEEQLQLLEELFPGLGFRVVAEDGLFKLLSPPLDEEACGQVLRRLEENGLPGFMRSTEK